CVPPPAVPRPRWRPARPRGCRAGPAGWSRSLPVAAVGRRPAPLAPVPRYRHPLPGSSALSVLGAGTVSPGTGDAGTVGEFGAARTCVVVGNRQRHLRPDQKPALAAGADVQRAAIGADPFTHPHQAQPAAIETQRSTATPGS